MTPTLSKYSIMLPVKNGGEYVKECVNSILAQTFSDFNLIVLDNNSNDGTLEWIQSVNDNRIIIYSSTHSLAMEQNWGRIKDVAKNEFITLIGHDDILKPDYLFTMDELIKKYPDASLYQTHFDLIDSSGTTIRSSRKMGNVQFVDQFLTCILNNEIDIMGTGFMMRSRHYDAIGGFPAYPYFLFCDIELWIRLVQISYLAVSEKNCFSYRHHRKNTSRVFSVINFSDGLEAFLNYLYELKQADAAFRKLLNRHAKNLVQHYVKSLAHRLLKEEIKTRNNYAVRQFVDKFQAHLDRLADNNTYNLSADPQLKIALLIDSNPITRKMFLVFKKLFPKPVFKN